MPKRKFTGAGGRAPKRRRHVVHRRGKARPRRALSTGYRGLPNQYRFVRETRPTTIDLGVAANGVSLVAGTGAIPNISVFEFPGLQFNQLPGHTDFGNLFANYKVDRIETMLIPQWQMQTQGAINPLPGPWLATGATPNLVVTRVNTKYLVNGLTIQATAEANLDELAQIQKKKRSMYSSKRGLKIITSRPRVSYNLNDGSGGTNVASETTPWLPLATADDQEFVMNDVLFASRCDGLDFAPGIWRYRIYHRVHFRTSFVG